jgi:peptidyl-prolyl cis-trans isomerase A (cyclophilin A)
MIRRILIALSMGFFVAPATAQRGAPAAAAAPILSAPTAAALARQGPDSFDLSFFTSKGKFTARVMRSLAPRGSDRAFHATRARYYDGVRFYRVLPGFMAQFGYNGNPSVNAAWEAHPLKDDPVKVSNSRGVLTFANRGPNTRTVQMFVNTANNQSLDGMGFAPIGRVIAGMSVVDSLYSGYGEGAPRGLGPDQGMISNSGNAYLIKSFPKLDRIDSARVVQQWP